MSSCYSEWFATAFFTAVILVIWLADAWKHRKPFKGLRLADLSDGSFAITEPYDARLNLCF
jgi:hypothetical protein